MEEGGGMSQSWRNKAAPVIAEVIGRVGIDDDVLLRRELRKAYPFGLRERWPYKVWLDEIKVQLGKKTNRDRIAAQKRNPLPGQRQLF